MAEGSISQIAARHRQKFLRESGKTETPADQASIKAKRQRQYELAEIGRTHAMEQRKLGAGKPWRPWTPLSKHGRLVVLRQAGFKGYCDYLKSSLWAEIRARVLAACERRCVCGKEANEAHHERYTQANLLGKSLDGLQGLCGSCHTKADRKMREKWYKRP